LNDVRVTNKFENVNLSGDPLDITDVLYLLLLKYLDGDLLAGKVVIAELHLPKRPLPYRLAYKI
jgi:hypothetical protein